MDWKRKVPVTRAEAFVDSNAFQATCCLIIALNAILIGVQVDIVTKNASVDPSAQNPAWFGVCNHLFVSVFTVEILLRIAIKRTMFFIGHDWKWNLFDFVTILLTVIEEYENLK